MMEEGNIESNNAAISSILLDGNHQSDAHNSNVCLSEDITVAALLHKVHNLEQINQKLEHDFNSQRAKMLELFKQKERELDVAKCHLMKAEKEYTSLKQLFQDKTYECTLCNSDIQRLKEESIRLAQENRELRQNLPNQELSSLSPQILHQGKTTSIHKLTGNNYSVLEVNLDESEADDNKSKLEGTYADEDAEVLRPILAQLHEENKALKTKLRETDGKLHSKLDTIDNQSNDLVIHVDNNQSQSCKKCASYAEENKALTQKSLQDKEHINTLEKQLQECNTDLEKQAVLRCELESQWQLKREAHRKEVRTLKEQVEKGESLLWSLQQKFLETKNEVLRQLLCVSSEREKVHKQLETLQADNDFLSGRYIATAEEIENQYINLPNKVEELHELILKQQQELIKARLGCDYEKNRYISSQDEIQLLKEKWELTNSDLKTLKKSHQTDIKSLQDRITQHLKTLQSSESAKVELEHEAAELNQQISDARVQNLILQEKNDNLTKLYSDATSKIKNLQSDLATSEVVQKDFVKLSQKLQMTLEQLRVADTEVRWQDEDDVSVCPNCKGNFTVTVRKVHCRHCGRIYCNKCLSKTVLSGPRQQPARVCDICHTLLRPNTAPYFSQETCGSQQTSPS